MAIRISQSRAIMTAGSRAFLHATIAITCAGVLMLCSACSRADERGDDRSVVLYVSADDFLARQVVAAFEEKTGIDVQTVGDTEATKTTGLANRLRNEADNPVADVFWSSECFMMIQLAEEGLLEPHVSDLTRDWTEAFTGKDHLWHGFGLRARVIVYSPSRLSEDQRPQTWLDLGKSRFRDRIVMADPRFGTTRGHLGAMLSWWGGDFGEDAYVAYLENLADNNIRLLTTGNAGVVAAVASGEADVGMTDTDDVWAAQRNGLDVKLIYPDHGLPGQRGGGTLLIPNTVARVKGGAHPAEAAALIDFLLSEEVDRMLVESDSHNIPIRDSIAEAYPQYAVENPLVIDLADAAAHMDRAVELAMAVLAASGDDEGAVTDSDATEGE